MREFWFLCVLCIVLAILIASIFNVDTAKASKEEPSNITYNKKYMKVFTDPVNGCQYLITDEGGIYPRLHTDGVQICNIQ